MTEQVWEFRTGCHNVIDDDALMRLPGDNRTFTAKELRSLGYEEHELRVLADDDVHVADVPSTEATQAQLEEFKKQLRKADPEFIKILWTQREGTNTASQVGKGVYLTQVDGHASPRERPFTFSGSKVLSPTGKAKTLESFAPPDAYQKGLEALRAAASRSTEPNFEDGWKAERARELQAQRDRMTAHVAAHPAPPRLTTAEVNNYAPPDPYKADLDKMRSERR
jgi:hypothetical protein